MPDTQGQRKKTVSIIRHSGSREKPAHKQSSCASDHCPPEGLPELWESLVAPGPVCGVGNGFQKSSSSWMCHVDLRSTLPHYLSVKLPDAVTDPIYGWGHCCLGIWSNFPKTWHVRNQALSNTNRSQMSRSGEGVRGYQSSSKGPHLPVVPTRSPSQG